MQYQLYDFSTKKYYRRINGSNWGWTCFKTEAVRFYDMEQAKEIIKYYSKFSSNDYRVLTVKPVTIRMKGREYGYAF